MKKLLSVCFFIAYLAVLSSVLSVKVAPGEDCTPLQECSPSPSSLVSSDEDMDSDLVLYSSASSEAHASTEDSASTEEPAPLYALDDYEYDVLVGVLYAECRGESLQGKKLVAQCIYDACIKEGEKPSEVVVTYAYASPTPSCDRLETSCLDSIHTAIDEVFIKGNFEVEDNILWFYAPAYSAGTFHNTQRFVIEVGGHRFYAPK